MAPQQVSENSSEHTSSQIPESNIQNSDSSGLNLEDFNTLTLNNLLTILSKIYSTNNLLILDPTLSPLVNSLTSFTKLKRHGNFENLIYLNQQSQYQDLTIFSKFSSLIILIEDNKHNLNLLEQLLFTNLGILNSINGLKINIIVKNLTNSFVYELNKICNGSHTFESILQLNFSNNNKIEKINSINIISRVKVWNWEALPIFNEDILIIDIDEKYSGIDEYFNEPLKQVNSLANALIQLLFIKENGNENLNYRNILKLKNIYGKGNHSDLLIKLIKESKIPEYLNQNLNNLEIEFYNSKLISNTDLIVIERNLDFFSVLLDQVNYHGLIDNLFDIQFNKIIGSLQDESQISDKILSNNNDELYTNTLKDLNFSTLGPLLNKLAKEVQQEFKNNKQDESTNIQDMKNIVSKLGQLTHKQDLIKKHTNISESIINKLTDFEMFLQFENDFFEMEYNLQLSKLKYFLSLNDKFGYEIILSIVILISIKNDGIRERDFDWINQSIINNYGLKVAMSLERFVQYKLIRLLADQGTNFLSVIGLSGNTTTATQHVVVDNNEDTSTQLGITGAQDTYKNNFTLIDKFWNLHPNQEDELESSQPIGIEDKVSLIDIYPHPSFTLPSNMVPLTFRLIESLYYRDFLTYKPINNVKKRPNWDNLGVGSMFKGKVIDINIDDKSDKRTTSTITANNNNNNNNNSNSTSTSTPSKTSSSSVSLVNKSLEYIVIVFIGGITRSEMSCLKYLQQKLIKNGKNKRIIVLTNGIINRKKLINFFID
ncbi:vacuolar sorting protein VPS33/slp1 [Scheffersomyces amazonensis]|uniref:vacuolar sorting protein VPS33/slp1 n=1 Tax=Scheffersomyces amazonensis TaxID=1078765 RepID=UPI00315D1D89